MQPNKNLVEGESWQKSKNLHMTSVNEAWKYELI